MYTQMLNDHWYTIGYIIFMIPLIALILLFFRISFFVRKMAEEGLHAEIIKKIDIMYVWVAVLIILCGFIFYFWIVK